MLRFAISCFKSEAHRWWFTPSPPPIRPTREARPRFIVTPGKSARHEKTPFQTYTRLLNALSEEEWTSHNLPPLGSVSVPRKSNSQLNSLSRRLNPQHVLRSTHIQNSSTQPAGCLDQQPQGPSLGGAHGQEPGASLDLYLTILPTNNLPIVLQSTAQ